MTVAGKQCTEDPSGVDADRSDEKLMQAFARGSQEAFAELFQRYKQPLFGFFRRRVADAGRAEELTQDTFEIGRASCRERV